MFIEMMLNCARLLLRGQLFRDNKAMLCRWTLGLSVTLALIAGLSFVNIWLAAGVGGFVGGALMPWLFRNLKFN